MFLAGKERKEFVFPGSATGETFEIGVVVVGVQGKGSQKEGLEG